MISDHLHLHWLQPVTTNEGASSGPRISTAGYEWREKRQGGGWLEVRMFADLDGRLWQEDFDVSRRGAQALVPFAKRAAAAIRGGLADVDTSPIPNQKDWYRTSLIFEDRPEAYARRINCRVDFPEVDNHPSVLAECEREWLERFAVIAVKMGVGLHVSVNDRRNRRLFYGDEAA